MLFKTVVLIMLGVVIFSLFGALYAMFKGKGQGDSMVKALTIRITLSLSLFIILMLGAYMGFITPNGTP